MAVRHEELEITFSAYCDDYLFFGRVENKLSNHPDLHALMFLDKLCPSELGDVGLNDIVVLKDMISSVHDDRIWLSINSQNFADAATLKDILNLVRSGVQYDSEEDSFFMFQ
jgi:hypothetical protein